MDKFFLIDEKRNIKKTYEEFIVDLNELSLFQKYIYFKNPYEIFLNLVNSMVLGKPVVLLDGDFSETEISKLGLNISEVNSKERVCKEKIFNFDELIKKVINKDWNITIFTSGTTGKPKKVKYTFSQITRGTVVKDKFSNNIWAFAYNPTHFAGLQVFFQAFLNKNSMVYIFDENLKEVENLFLKYNITHISATPTFYRLFLQNFSKPNNNVEQVTMGGEKFDCDLKEKILTIFPNARIKNIYASTEAGSLFASDGEIFKLSDKYVGKVKISDTGELFIHKDLLGQFDKTNLHNDWYPTGDLVEKVDENSFRFVSRKTEMINVGGYKVNPHEIEEILLEFDFVDDCLVSARANKVTGNILVAEIKINKKFANKDHDFKKIIFSELKEKVQPWKIPRIINFVDEISSTRTGKKVRK